MTDGARRALAESLAPRLAAVGGVAAVGLGGSVARGTDDAGSDVDIGIYYSRRTPPDLVALRRLADDVDDRGSVELTQLGGWGPRINGGGWLVVRGTRVDWLYREVEAVEEAIASCRAGVSVPVHQPGHPWGWQPQIYAGEVAYGVPLADPSGELTRLQSAALPYPGALREAKLAALWEAEFSLGIAEKSAARGATVLVVACLSRVAAVLVDAIFAANGRYLVNEKQAAEIGTTVDGPPGVWSAMTATLAAPGSTADELIASVASARIATEAVAAWLARGEPLVTRG